MFTTFFQALYGALSYPEYYFYEFRYIRPGDVPYSIFLKYPQLLSFLHSRKAEYAKSKNEEGYNIYFGINPRKKRQGSKADVACAVAAFVDIDVKDFLPPAQKYQEDIDQILAKKAEVLQGIRDQSRQMRPSIVVDSGRGFQLYWLFQQPILLFQDENWESAVNRLEGINHRLEQHFHGDHVGNIDRIFRVPSFFNRKPRHRGAADLCHLDVVILHCDPARYYTLEELERVVSATPAVEAKIPVSLSTQQILEKVRHAANGEKFLRLFAGDWSGYKSQSEAEYALCAMASFWTQDRSQIDAIFRQSGLYREKWNIPFNGTTNGWYTIDKVLNNLTSTYDSTYQKPKEPKQKQDGRFIFHQFWYEIPNKDEKFDLDYADFLKFLTLNGFGLLIMGTNSNQYAEVIRVKENVISSTLEQNNTNLTIRRFVLDFLEHLKAENVEKVVLRRASTLFSLNFLMSLKPLHLHFYRDSGSRCTFFFKNGFVSVTTGDGKTESTFHPYSELRECIWESQIAKIDLGRRQQQLIYEGIRSQAPQNLEYREQRQAEFKRFMEFVSQETIGSGDMFELLHDNFPAFCYGLSYLIHSYKDVSRAFAVLLVDNDPSEFSQGRRGKSLFAQVIDFFRKLTYEDGKTLNTESQFVFQSIESDSQVVQIEDVRKNFDFELFYPTITGPCVREQKNKGRVKIHFKESPKFVFTSNRPILGNGDSDLARWYILPFVSYFNRHFTPFDQFGHRLFDDWDQKEWNNFFDFIIDCMEQYLAYSNCALYKRPTADLSTYNEEKLHRSMDAEFIEYFEAAFAKLPFRYPKRRFFEEFKEKYPVFADRKIAQNKFTLNLKVYCQARDLIYMDRNFDTTEAGREENLLICQKEKK